MRSKPTPKEPVKRSNVFHCVACKEDFDMLAAGGEEALKNHLRVKHLVNDFKGTKSMAMQMDGDRWFAWTFNWNVGGVQLVQNTVDPRSKEDQMYWDHA